MASIESLVDVGQQEMDSLLIAVTEVLQKKGVLNDLKAQVRAEIFKALSTDSQDTSPALKHPVADPGILELVSEFLVFHKLTQTLSVLEAETGIKYDPKHPTDLLKKQTLQNHCSVLQTILHAKDVVQQIINRSSNQMHLPWGLLFHMKHMRAVELDISSNDNFTQNFDRVSRFERRAQSE